ncbi:uncharacterized protein F4807DRAFT_463969 [Annulohypoxylon truncatum]|uniref:uncharacterized protein n=1 Tax=Annulohypoxylon truncatum TaxID=327061 RepID=UPI002008318D|nr:uncharacterized protein F4807DRAFT_463969 [Annulohypoxylon truncatum]KAI1206205.1 hypothetical protein F4807DRAFT_463969 [Annulohypoxylon truncatum]
MKLSTKGFLIIALRATHVLAKKVPRSSDFEVRRRDPSPDAAVAQNWSADVHEPPPLTDLTDIFMEPPTNTSGTVLLWPPLANQTESVGEGEGEGEDEDGFEWFNLDNSIEVSEMPNRSDWVIPVSHSWCSSWDIKDVNARGSIQEIIMWNNRGNKVKSKSVHWELDGMVGAYVCDCKWGYFDKATAWEMWEFYERMIEWCGEGHAGWIFSKKWEKGYAISTRDKILYTKPKKTLCPKFCCFDPKSQKMEG